MMILAVAGVILGVCIITVPAPHVPHTGYEDADDDCVDLWRDCHKFDDMDDECSTQVGMGHYYTYYSQCPPGTAKKMCKRDCIVDADRDSLCAVAESQGHDWVVNVGLCTARCGLGWYTVDYTCHGKLVQCRYRCCCHVPPCGEPGPPVCPSLGIPCARFRPTTWPEACDFP